MPLSPEDSRGLLGSAQGSQEPADEVVDQRAQSVDSTEGVRNQRELIGHAVVREVAGIDDQLAWGRSDQLRQLMRQDPTLGKDTDNSLSQNLGRLMRAPDTASNMSATNMTSNPYPTAIGSRPAW